MIASKLNTSFLHHSNFFVENSRRWRSITLRSAVLGEAPTACTNRKSSDNSLASAITGRLTLLVPSSRLVSVTFALCTDPCNGPLYLTVCCRRLPCRVLQILERHRSYCHFGIYRAHFAVIYQLAWDTRIHLYYFHVFCVTIDLGRACWKGAFSIQFVWWRQRPKLYTSWHFIIKNIHAWTVPPLHSCTRHDYVMISSWNWHCISSRFFNL